MRRDVERFVAAWLERPEISARTVLVTILGDVVRPVGNSLWLSQLSGLGDPFGFSNRLVRTSLSRLVAEDWVENERIGRQSRYSLTALALRASEEADRRIYHSPSPSGADSWVVAVIDPDRVDELKLDAAVRELGWRGFAPIDTHVLVAPGLSANEADDLIDGLIPAEAVSVGQSTFDGVGALVAAALRVDPFERSAADRAYRELADGYEEFLLPGRDPLDGVDAYAVRVMLIHDLRRLVLRSAPTPRELLPDPWAGDRAFAVSAELYRQVCETSAAWLSDSLELTYPRHLADRFPGLADT